MTTVSATTILRSRFNQKVLSTLLLRYPRCIHAEFMTHRMLSKNSASSRAIPVEKLIKDVMDDPFIPLHWGRNQKGMQADEECNELVRNFNYSGFGHDVPLTNDKAWLKARDNAVTAARAFSEAGYHKQIVNRLLEPFAHITVVCSSTEWDNFLRLRDDPAAEPHIQMLAREIRRELKEGPIQDLKHGEWHLPFVTKIEKVHSGYSDYGTIVSKDVPTDDPFLQRVVSVARCASTSYKTVDGFDMSVERAIEVYDKLVTSKPEHLSPLEHVAQAHMISQGGNMDHIRLVRGNFRGFWSQLRHMPWDWKKR